MLEITFTHLSKCLFLSLRCKLNFFFCIWNVTEASNNILCLIFNSDIITRFDCLKRINIQISWVNWISIFVVEMALNVKFKWFNHRQKSKWFSTTKKLEPMTSDTSSIFVLGFRKKKWAENYWNDLYCFWKE